MADHYWSAGVDPSAHAGKRTRPGNDFVPPGGGLQMGVHAGQGVPGYLARDDGHATTQAVKDTKSLMASYERYLQTGQISNQVSGESSNLVTAGIGGRPTVGGLAGPPIHQPLLMDGPGFPDIIATGQNIPFGNQPPLSMRTRPGLEVHLPPDASDTLFVEGLPPDCSHREVAHIFRPFLGYKEVRLVKKEPKRPGGDPVILCFVDFANAHCAATTLNALHGYVLDEQDSESPILRMQFARYPGPRPGGGSMSSRGRR